MRTLITFLPVVACAGGMVLCMVLMRVGHKTPAAERSDTAAEVAALRDEVARLRADRPVDARDHSA